MCPCVVEPMVQMAFMVAKLLELRERSGSCGLSETCKHGQREEGWSQGFKVVELLFLKVEGGAKRIMAVSKCWEKCSLPGLSRGTSPARCFRYLTSRTVK